MMTREMDKLERSLGGIKDLGGIPDVVFVIDIGHEKNAIREAQKLHLPIIGIVDTNHNPEGIDYVVPGNDDSIRAIGFYAREVANAILEAKAAAGTQVKEAPTKKSAAKTKPDARKKEAKEEVTKAKEVPAKEAVAKEPTTTEKPEKLSKTALNAMKKAELVTYAEKQGVSINSSDTKVQIIEKLV
ncbi:SSU ribosomal protein S2p (SAe) [hydrothermal vent metagenome]|uniref:SSU ribosomal protein S2p (SAe) n=1 Tax=hydrothermal vent metagenome TaxID=652676 RepID=A0A1W1DHA8_9ZZZZ